VNVLMTNSIGNVEAAVHEVTIDSTASPSLPAPQGLTIEGMREFYSRYVKCI